jgi:16S rRNA (cytidine1402-2'-O)-methyltransferase
MSALAISGLPVRSFRYEGFLPRRQADRRALLASLAAETRTVVMFEAPHRLCETLEDILEVCGDRPLAAARELTKVHEEVVRGTVSEVLAHFRRRRPRGEFTLVLGGAQAAQQPAAGEQELERALRALLEEGVSLRDAARRLATVYGVSRRQVYQTAVRLGLADE